MAFSSAYKILFAAGFLHYHQQESVYSSPARRDPAEGNGSTTVFYTEAFPIVDGNDSGTVTTADVTFYVNEVAVTVSSIDAALGKITLAAAPASNAVLAMDYYSSPVTSAQITFAQNSASSKVIDYVGHVYVLPIDSASVNALYSGSQGENKLIELETWLAAALLLLIMYTEENNSFHAQGVLMKRAVESDLKRIYDGEARLVDTASVEFQRNDLFSPSGYPNGSAESEDEDFKFSVTTQL